MQGWKSLGVAPCALHWAVAHRVTASAALMVAVALTPGCSCGGPGPRADGGGEDMASMDMDTAVDVDMDRVDQGPDPLACTLPGRSLAVRLVAVDSIDLLFMVDNSLSMLQEQAALVEELPRIVEVLASGDRDGDGSQDFPPLASIHVGVITSDMGVGGVSLPAAARCSATLGDDGVLLTVPRGNDPSCATSYPPFLEFMADTDDPAVFAAEVGCLAMTGADGCSFEQQLEAVLKALTPAGSDVVFPQVNRGTLVRTTQGHGGSGVNGGFLRDTSMLAMIMVTDEDDCSSRDIGLYDFFRADAVYPLPLDTDGDQTPNRQCAVYRDVQYDVLKRYVTGLLAVRPDFHDLLVFAVISGVSPEVVAANTITETIEGRTRTVTDYQGILASASMQERANVDGSNLVPSCTRPNPDDPTNPAAANVAVPPRRLVQVAEGLDRLGANGVIASICQARDPENDDFAADFSPAVDEILLAIENALPPGCVDDDLARRPGGEVQCEVLETLPPGVTCASQASRGRDPVRVRLEGAGPNAREVCRVLQRVPTADDVTAERGPSGEGWYYDDYTALLPTRCPPGHQAIVFSVGGGLTVGAEMSMECLVPPPIQLRADVGTACVVDPGACTLTGEELDNLRTQYRRPNATLVCAGAGNCHLSCTTDDHCPALQRCVSVSGQSVCQDPLCVE